MSSSSSHHQYLNEYQDSIHHPETFWADHAKKELEWFAPFTQTFEWNRPRYRWFINGELNISHNCLDRHVNQGRGQQLAYIYLNEQGEEIKISYLQLLQRVNQTANALRELGVKKGDRVIIYMPLTLEQIAVMLACARIGAVHSVVYAGFSAEALAVRVKDAQAKVIFTATSTKKNNKHYDLLRVVRQAAQSLSDLKKIVVFQRSWDKVELLDNEQDFQHLVSEQSQECSPLAVESSTPLFILYTSGTTGTPKGIVHGHGGYNLYTHLSFKRNFGVVSHDHCHWTAADTGWVTGHSYLVYGPLSNGVTSVIYEGSPTYPNPDRYWQLVEKYRVETFYTAPTVIRLLMREGADWPAQHDLSSLRIIGSVGEPISPAAWEWYAEHIGRRQAAVIDTWWQTETGGHMLVTPPQLKQKPGSAGLPFLGIEPSIVDEHGNEITQSGVVGQLIIKKPWPGALLDCWNNPDRFAQYWDEFGHQSCFYTGDVAQRDEEGYFTVLGRADDVINVAGIRIGTAEVESALVAHEAVAEAAAVGVSDELKGEVIHVFIILNPKFHLTEQLSKELKLWVREKIGYIAQPAKIVAVAKLPKTRSGKIMRRILKAKELGLVVGDTSTLEE